MKRPTTMTKAQELSSPPRLIPTIVAGFDAITTHILLIVFPLGLDLILWLAPRLRLTTLIQELLAEFAALPVEDSPELVTMLETSRETWLQLAEQINLVAALRSYPVGVPGLLASSPPLETPLGMPATFDLPTAGEAWLAFALLTLAGLTIGALYFSLVAQAALNGEIRWRQTLLTWPRASWQVIVLAFIWLGLLLLISIPASCLLSFAALGGVSPGMCVSLLYGSALVWLVFELLFSAHGIFVNQMNAFAALRAGIRMTNATLPGTMLFVMTAVVLSQGLDLLWRIPPTDSWLMLVGLAGHAFVATGLLSASFVYYRDACLWVAQRPEPAPLSEA